MASCLKCGLETKDKAAFCDECREAMQRDPVDPGAVAVLQPRPKLQEYKPAASRPDAAVLEKLKTLRGTVRWLVTLTVILSLLLLATTGMLLHSLQKEPETQPIGKNYTTTQTQAP